MQFVSRLLYSVAPVLSLVASSEAIRSSRAAATADVVLRFGSAVAVAGDEVLVGRSGVAERADSPNGGVHVYHRTAAGRWREVAVLAPRDITQEDDFGSALAVDGRLLAVGAPRADGGRGVVYLFERAANGRWVEQAKLAASTATAGEHFGAVLALRDGILVIGAPAYAGDRGRVMVFRRGTDVQHWTESTILAAGDTFHMGFGGALALSHDRVFIGASGPIKSYNPERDGPAQVLIFRDSAGSWLQEARLAPDSEGNFGAALLADGSDLWVSNPLRGVVFHFQRGSTNAWSDAGQLVTTAPEVTEFGAQLALGEHDLFIGAPRGDRGAIFVFRYDSISASWTEVQYIADSATRSERNEGPARFGERLAAAGGVAVIGVFRDGNFEGSSIVLVRDRASGHWQWESTLVDTVWTSQQPVTGGELKCLNGRVKIFDCRNTDLAAFLPISAISGSKHRATLSGVWGWSDSATGREFAIVGRSDGTAFVEVTDPTRPKYLGDLPVHAGANNSPWRDMKVYKNYAFIVSDAAGPFGTQIFDLTQLRDVKDPPAVFRETAHYDRVNEVHTIALNEATGYAYLAGNGGGGETCGGGLHIVDVRTPTNPTFAGCYHDAQTVSSQSSPGYIHETVCILYHGPDAQYQGREICLNSAVSALTIVDVTDKQHPKPISLATYPSASYAHQGWFDKDQRYFFLDDELDEDAMDMRESDTTTTVRTRTIIFDLRDLDDPVVAKEFFGTTGATDHNLYVRDRYMYQSNYKAGLRIIDVQDPRNPQEVGYFDTAPAYDNVRGFAGSWTNYPYFKSGVIAVTNMNEGLFLVRFRAPLGAP